MNRAAEYKCCGSTRRPRPAYVAVGLLRKEPMPGLRVEYRLTATSPSPALREENRGIAGWRDLCHRPVDRSDTNARLLGSSTGGAVCRTGVHVLQEAAEA